MFFVINVENEADTKIVSPPTTLVISKFSLKNTHPNIAENNSVINSIGVSTVNGALLKDSTRARLLTIVKKVTKANSFH